MASFRNLRLILALLALFTALSPAYGAVAPSTYGSIPGQAGTSWLSGFQTYLRMQAVLDGNAAQFKGGDMTSTFRLGARYRLSKANSIGVFKELQIINEVEGRPAESSLRDLFLDFAHARKLGKSDWRAVFHFREYFPTGAISKRNRQRGREQAWVDFSKDYGSFVVSSQLNASLRRHASPLRISPSGKVRGLTKTEQAVYSGIAYHLTSKADIWQRVGLRISQRYVPEHRTHRSFFEFANETGFAYLCQKNLIASVAYGDLPGFGRGRRLRLFQPENSAVRFALDWRL
jgi:hypothetical protein